ncbi:MAG: ABC transporter permease [Thermoproteota archaeon]
MKRIKLPIRETTKKVWSRRIKNFWFEYSHNKIGLVGLGMLSIFAIMALFSPVLAPYSIDEVRTTAPRQSYKFAVPEWFTLIFPHLSDLPPTLEFPLQWNLSDQNLPESITAYKLDNGWFFIYNASRTGSREPVTVFLESKINYQYAPTKEFDINFRYIAQPNATVTIYRKIAGKLRPVGVTSSMMHLVELSIIHPLGFVWKLWDQNWDRQKTVDPYTKPAYWSESANVEASLFTSEGRLAIKLGYEPYETVKMTQHILSAKGEYILRLNISFKPPEPIGGVEIPIEEVLGNLTIYNGKLKIWGLKLGILGADAFGHDVFSQIIHGARISLIFGLTCAAIAVTFGLLVGVTAGYIGGFVDEFLMRIVDILICLPVLPILLIFIALFGYNLWYLVLIYAFFGWQGLSRVIRSQTLSLRETSFVECAIASGGSRSYIILRHIVPNVFPTAVAALILSVPGAIITEAALSFLGFSDPTSPTWGRMLQTAYEFGAFSPTNLALWNILPPGICITSICLSFVFIGHAVDEIVNPKLRRRR